jgi:PPOX class probable F420-dependent enzyme
LGLTKLGSDVEAFLKGKHFAKLATVNPDGSPQLTPIWYMCVGRKLIVNTAAGRVKLRNIRRDPRVVLLIDNGYDYVAFSGIGRVAEERDGFKDIEALAIRYHGLRKGKKDAREVYSKQKRVSIEVVPQRLVKNL